MIPDIYVAYFKGEFVGVWGRLCSRDSSLFAYFRRPKHSTPIIMENLFCLLSRKVRLLFVIAASCAVFLVLPAMIARAGKRSQEDISSGSPAATSGLTRACSR